jgi:GTP cyclohydrolase II
VWKSDNLFHFWSEAAIESERNVSETRYPMTISISLPEKLARARADVRMGLPIVLAEEGLFWMAFAVETLTKARLSELRAMTGDIHIALTKWRAETLAAPAYDGDLVRIKAPFDVAVTWLHAMADPSFDLQVPMKGPFAYLREGSAKTDRAMLQLCKSAALLPCALLMPVANPPNDLLCLDLQDVIQSAENRIPLDLISNAKVPLGVAKNARVHVFRRRDGGEEHYAIEIGKPARNQPVLSRLHSACFTGDLIGSLKCDCGAQLQSALQKIGTEGSGVLLYLNQEGRGIGLANKMRAYSLQDQGFDTVEANHRLGFEDDERDFHLGAEILRILGFRETRLMTNNPEKVARMQEAGIKVTERVPLQVGRTPQNTHYLDTKAKKSGHLL